MEIMIILIYTALCIALFAILRIPLNRWTVPTASVGGLALIFGLVQFLNYFHPYSDTSRQYSSASSYLVASFPASSLLRLDDDNMAEVTFDSIPGRVFSGQVQTVLPNAEDDTQIQLLVTITDPHYQTYASRLQGGFRAQTSVYGEQFQELALVRKTLLRMSAWMNYLSPIT